MSLANGIWVPDLVHPTPMLEADRVIVQQNDQAVSNATTGATLVNSELTLPILANQTYEFTIDFVANNAGTSAGFKCAVTGPASPTRITLNGMLQNSTSGILHQTVGSLTTIIAGGITTTGLKYGRVWGEIKNGANAGYLTFQFAQNTADAGATTLKAGSRMWVKQIE